ncbi:glycosyltransferase family 4 protein [Gottfriedia sp. NPDC057991]|uniref:glycosyltransferase family 4 protein n=1 Tax=Gottfriedia sp. NPDC057991 TaxID=3346298 RepID=UPI0036DDE550
MNVLHINSGLYFGGGSERIIMDLMTKNNLNTNYLCVINDMWSKEHISKLHKGFYLLCNRKQGTKNVISNIKTIIKACKFIRKNQIDIIHCHDTFSLKFAYILKKMLGLKVVFTVHDTNVYTAKLNKFPIDKYVAISNTVYKIVSGFVPKNKIELIYNGIDLNKFYNNKKRNKNKQECINISCVARLVPEKKGQDILIGAVDIIKKQYGFNNFKCFFAGTATDQCSLNELKELVKKNRLENHVEFLGNIEKVEEVYSNTDIFVLPSRYEGFGLVVVEALAAGCVVIVSKLDGPLEIVKENELYGLSFEKDNHEELAKKIYHLINDVNLRNHFSNNVETLKYLNKEFSLDNMIAGYNKIYKSV